MPCQATDDPRSPSVVDDLTFSRRGFGKRLLLGASGLAILLAASKREELQAAPLSDPWRLGGNTAVTTDGTNFLGTKTVAPLIFKTTPAAGSAPAERMRIGANGLIGIGTTAPAGRLHSRYSSALPAVLGENVSTAAGATGVLGKLTSTTPGTDAAAVRGVNTGTNDSGAGVQGKHAGDGYGVYGTALGLHGSGVYGQGGATGVRGDGFMGVYGTGTAIGVGAFSSEGIGVEAKGGDAGVWGRTDSAGSTAYGVHGTGYGKDSIGVLGEARYGTEATGIWGVSSSGWAGYFTGKAHVTGLLSKGGGSFKIDHPLDPENKTLSHSFVESPDMMNVYNGNVTLDAKGEATVEMPGYFEALNRDFRYQLTALGAPGPNLYIAEEISGNTFKIAGGKAGMKVSWQVTGIRQDAFANANRIPVEEDKREEQRGKYLHPKEHGKPESAGVDAERRAKLHEKTPQREHAPQGPHPDVPPSQ